MDDESPRALRKPVHGPFGYRLNAAGKRYVKPLGRGAAKADIAEAINNKKCPCKLCEVNGQRPMPRSYYWSRSPTRGSPDAPYGQQPVWIYAQFDWK